MNESHPLISLVVPVYNTSKYLSKCLDSILSQTHKNLQIILIDDGSTDNSYNICQEYAAKDPRITLIKRQNGGVSSARNAGLDMASGDYIGFVDSDDHIEPHMYEKLLQALLKEDAELAQCCARKISADGVELWNNSTDYKILNDKKSILDSYIIKDALNSMMCTKLFKSSLIRKTRFPNLKHSEDRLFFSSLIEKIEKAVIIPHILYNIVMSESSASRSSFSLNKLDTVKASTQEYELLNHIYPEYAPFSSYLACYYSSLCYYKLKGLPKEASTITAMKDLKKTFSFHYKEFKRSQMAKASAPKTLRAALALFNAAPKLHYAAFQLLKSLGIERYRNF